LEFALRLWKEAAEAGIPQAAFNLGVWLKNSGDVEKGKLYLKKAGELGYLDGYFVLAGVFYKEEDWDSMDEFLAPLLEIGDKRAVTMQKAVQEKLKESEFIDAEDEEDDEYVFHSFGERTIKLDDA
jgi:TPR repeat protein